MATAAAKGKELRNFDAEQAFLKTDTDEEIYIEIPEEYQEFLGAIYIEIPEEYREFPGAVGLLKNTIYGLVQAGSC